MWKRTLCANCLCLVVLCFSSARASDFDRAVDLGLPIAKQAYEFLHENPELGRQEVRAQAYIRERLTSFGFTEFIVSTLAPTAVIAIADSGRAGPTIMLRAELDARRLEPGHVEPTYHKPRSGTDGLMHNCGHDVHAAILLGAAAVFVRNSFKFSGRIIFLFQPAEETAGGADDIVREGLLSKLNVTKIFAQHVTPGLPVGSIAISPGYVLASSSYFSLKIKGRSSHAAVPFEGDDVPLVAARIAQELVQLPSRKLDIANRPVVLSITRMTADGGPNAIPGEAELRGTIRAFENIEEPTSNETSLKSIFEDAVARMALAANVDYDWSLRSGAPATLNNVALFHSVTRALEGVWPGTLNLRPWRGMFAEDFAFYTKFTPALYFSLGIAKEGRGFGRLHTSEFDIHIDALDYGLRLMLLLGVIGTTGAPGW